jgi:hypothetical protein
MSCGNYGEASDLFIYRWKSPEKSWEGGRRLCVSITCRLRKTRVITEIYTGDPLTPGWSEESRYMQFNNRPHIRLDSAMQEGTFTGVGQCGTRRVHSSGQD